MRLVKIVSVSMAVGFLAIPLAVTTATILTVRLSFFLAEEIIGWLEEK